MVEMRMRWDTSKVDKALANADPEDIARCAQGAIFESLGYLQGQIKKDIPVDTGGTRGRIFIESRGMTFAEMQGMVASPDKHAVVLEKGRRPGGRMPPIDAIQLWVHHKGLAGTYSLKTHRRTGGKARIASEDRSAAFLIARAIARRGLPALKIFENAAERGRKTVQRIFERHFSDLFEG